MAGKPVSCQLALGELAGHGWGCRQKKCWPAGQAGGMLWGGVTLPRCPHSILTLSDYVTELGHPYVWVQKLGGLHFPKDQPQACHTPSPLSQNVWGGFGDSCCVLSPETPKFLLALAAPKPWSTFAWDGLSWGESMQQGHAKVFYLPPVIV